MNRIRVFYSVLLEFMLQYVRSLEQRFFLRLLRYL